MNAEALCQAAYGERSDERINSRNGYRDRGYETRAGKVDLKIPKLRTGSYFSRISRAAQDGRKGPHGSDPGSLYSGNLDPLGR